MTMNKEEDYRNLAGNITAFTDNTCYYEDWLVIQQYVDDWLDEIDRLNNIINELEKYIKENSIYYNTSDGCQWIDQFKLLDKLKELKENNK